ncbi:MAG: HD domain-containing protein, partial [Candidatus Nanohaloarchaea archaeon]|nr:HD domain-containing protein [Candidatus Nanohaloarchaea archaeon]
MGDMFIQDAVHGYIRLDQCEQELLNAEAMQRLRRIYPSANHTRFEHCLGVCYLAGQFADYLDLSHRERQQLRVAGLLHDIGHGPYSHTSEMVMQKHGMSHEDFSERTITETEIASILERHDLDPDRIASMIHGETELGQIIAGDIDVDRMDYLMRDAKYTGVAHGTIDDETIMRAAELRDGDLVFREKFIPAMEGLLTARHLMIPTVYTHGGVQRAEKMMKTAINALVEEDKLAVEELGRMDDIDMKAQLRRTDVERASYLNGLLDARDIFKTALHRDESDIGREGLRTLASQIEDEETVEEKIADAAGLPLKEVVVSRPSIPRRRESAVEVLADGKQVPLNEVSKLTRAVHGSEWEQ